MVQTARRAQNVFLEPSRVLCQRASAYLRARPRVRAPDTLSRTHIYLPPSIRPHNPIKKCSSVSVFLFRAAVFLFLPPAPRPCPMADPGAEAAPAVPGGGETKKEIYNYKAPWTVYAMGWSHR